MTAPALVTERLQRRRLLARSPLTALDPRSVRIGLRALAVLESAADKIPHLLPARTVLPSFLARVASGGVSAAALARAERRAWPMGAVLGMVAAGVTTAVSLRVRERLGRELDIHDALVGALEDGLVRALGRVLLQT